MMVSGVRTSSGFEERIRFSEMEIIDRDAIDTAGMSSPEGSYINGWDVNVCAVRITSVRKRVRQHKHAEFLLRVKRKGELEHFVGRRYGDFHRLHRRLRAELPGKVLPPLPKKNKSDATAGPGLLSAVTGNDSDNSSSSSVSTQLTSMSQQPSSRLPPGNGASLLVPSMCGRAPEAIGQDLG